MRGLDAIRELVHVAMCWGWWEEIAAITRPIATRIHTNYSSPPPPIETAWLAGDLNQPLQGKPVQFFLERYSIPYLL